MRGMRRLRAAEVMIIFGNRPQGAANCICRLASKKSITFIFIRQGLNSVGLIAFGHCIVVA